VWWWWGRRSLCLAEAQQIAVQKAMAKGTSDSLLAKLILDISQKYNNVRCRVALPDDRKIDQHSLMWLTKRRSSVHPFRRRLR
jgi:hypothetical protein